MIKYSLEKLSGKYEYIINGIIHTGYGLCRNEEVDSCMANSEKEAIDILRERNKIDLDKNGYKADGLISWVVCEYI
jgi:hypothetical protein